MVQYYTLEEAAQLLKLSAEKLKEMVRKNELRAFQDRGTLRFRKQEIDELARARGLGSDPDLPLGEVSKGGGPSSSSARRRAQAYNFAADDEMTLGDEDPGTKSKSPSSKKKHSPPPKSTPPSPRPTAKAASDSDVRLVGDAADLDFHLELDEEEGGPKSKPPSSGSKKSSLSPPPSSKSKLEQPKKSKVEPPTPRKSVLKASTPSDSDIPLLAAEAAADSNVRLERDDLSGSNVPASRSEVKSRGDSDIRMEGRGPKSGKRPDDANVTEEIDLDAEAERIEEARKKGSSGKKPSLKPGSAGALPTSSPFELSENDLDMGLEPPASKEGGELGVDSSGDFELTAGADEMSPLELSSDEKRALKESRPSEEVDLGEPGPVTGGDSGINIQEPADSGLSLEQGGSDEIDFELSLDAGSTPKPAPAEEDDESGSSEFELSLPDEEGLAEQTDSDSEFELTLDDDSSSSEVEAEDGTASGSDSEFELTLDESGGLAAVEESTEEGEGKDIFETDFDVPALEDESGSDAVALEESSEESGSSEFELTLDGDQAGVDLEDTDQESVAEDFAVEEDEASPTTDYEVESEEDEPKPKPRRKTKTSKLARTDEEDEEGLDLEIDTSEADEDEEEPAAVGAGAAAAPAAPVEWGALPATFLLPAVIVLVLTGLMGYEMIQGTAGFRKGNKASSLILDPLSRAIDNEYDKTFPKDK
jgi:excisionase family DNA binding protein